MSTWNTEWLADCTEYLPEDWKLVLTLDHTTIDIELVAPDGEIIELDDGDEVIVEDAIQRRVDHARVQDGLEPHFGETI